MSRLRAAIASGFFRSGLGFVRRFEKGTSLNARDGIGTAAKESLEHGFDDRGESGDGWEGR